MRGKRRFERSLKLFSERKKDEEIFFSGLLGIVINGEQTVDVSGRDGFVWVRLRNAQNEYIQAFNPTTAQVYNLPVLVKRDEHTPTRYVVVGRDSGRYQNWGSSSPYFAHHGNVHSFGPGGGADVTWVYGRQFMPLNAAPSGTSGGPNVIVHPYTYFFNDNWHYAGGTGTSSLLTSKPTNDQARLVLLYLDVPSGNPLLTAGSEFDASLTGSSQIVPYIPDLGDPLTQIPIAAVRLVSGTARIGWDNIYDLKPHYSVSSSGTSGGGGSGGQFYVSGDDTTLGFGEDKIAAGAGIEINVLNPGANEQLQIVNTGATGTSTTFLDLADTPSSYAGQALRALRVNAGQSALEFADFPIGPTGTVKVSANDALDRFLEDKLAAGSNITLTTINEGGNEQVQIASSGGGGAGTTFSGARRHLASGTSVLDSSWTNIEFHWEMGDQDFDTDDYFQSGTSPNSDISPPEAGYYHIYGQAWFESPPTGVYIQAGIWLNGTAQQIAGSVDGYFANGGLDRPIFVSSDYYLDVTDTVRLRVFTNTSGQTIGTGSARTFLGIHRISPPDTFEGARVYRTSNQTIASGTATAIQWQTEEYDEGDYYDAGSNTRFTVPQTGYYHLVGQVGWEQNNEGDREVYFRLNGGSTIKAQTIDEPISNNNHHMLVASDVQLDANDYVELVVINGRPGNTNVRAGGGDALGAETYMCIHYLGS